jgi:hypothetical protein
MQLKQVPILFAAMLLLLALGCGGGEKATPTPIIIVVTPAPGQSETTEATEAVEEPTQPPATVVEQEPAQPAASVEVLDAVFAHGLTEEMEPVDPGSDFGSSETVYLSVKLKGRPKEGEVIAHFYWLDSFIADAAVDLADANSGVIFSIGENTYVGYTLSHEETWPLGYGYRADLFYGDQALGSYPFRIAPPAGAIPTQITDVVLAKGADENYNPIEPATTFAPGEAVYLVGRGDLGQESWIQADWFVSGQLDEAGTRSITLEEDLTDAGFSFSFLPEAGWPSGEHYVVLTVDGEEVGRYSFTIVSSG